MFVSVSALCLTEETQREKIFSKYALRDTAELKSPNMINPPLQDFPELLQLTDASFCGIFLWKITEKIERLL